MQLPQCPFLFSSSHKSRFRILQWFILEPENYKQAQQNDEDVMPVGCVAVTNDPIISMAFNNTSMEGWLWAMLHIFMVRPTL